MGTCDPTPTRPPGEAKWPGPERRRTREADAAGGRSPEGGQTRVTTIGPGGGGLRSVGGACPIASWCACRSKDKDSAQGGCIGLIYAYVRQTFSLTGKRTSN